MGSYVADVAAKTYEIALLAPSEADLRKGIAAASTQKMRPDYLVVQTKHRSYDFPADAQVVRSAHALAVLAYRYIFVYKLDEASVATVGATTTMFDARSLPSVNAPHLDAAALGRDSDRARFPRSERLRGQLCPDCVEMLVSARMYHRMLRAWHKAVDPWRASLATLPRYLTPSIVKCGSGCGGGSSSSSSSTGGGSSSSSSSGSIPEPSPSLTVIASIIASMGPTDSPSPSPPACGASAFACGIPNPGPSARPTPCATPGTPGPNPTSPVTVKTANGATLTDAEGQPVMRPNDGQDPAFFIAQGEADLLNVQGGLFTTLAQLPNFRSGGPWDEQRVGGSITYPYISYASIVIGLFAESAGIPENVLLAISNQYASGHKFGPVAMDSTYTNLPARNVANEKLGYSLAQSNAFGVCQ